MVIYRRFQVGIEDFQTETQGRVTFLFPSKIFILLDGGMDCAAFPTKRSSVYRIMKAFISTPFRKVTQTTM